MIDPRGRALWVGVIAATFALSTATVIGSSAFDGANGLGEPMWRTRWIWFYEPWRALEWWHAWSGDEQFRATYIHGLQMSALISALVGALGLHLVRTYGPLPHVEAEEQPNRYGSVGDLLKSKRISTRQRGIVLGLSRSDVVYHVGDDHVLLVGASRVGEKGVSFVLPTLADCPDSMIVFDPKRELFEATADERAKHGAVYLFDPTRPGTRRFNPLLEMRTDERNIGDCRVLGALLTHDMKGRDPFWATKAADLLSACLRVVSIDGGPRTLERVREMVLAVAAGKPPATSDKYASEMIAAHMALEWRPRSGVDSQTQLALAFAGDPVVAAATASSEFRTWDLCAEAQPATVYITLPASQSESLRGIARVVLQALLLGMLHERTEALNGARKTRRVTMLIDEFPALGHLPFIEHGLAVAAGYGLRAFVICQSVEQIKDTYGPNETIMGNVGTFLWVPSLSKGTYEEVTASAGTMIAALRARHRKVGVMDRPSETVSQSRHPVVNPRDAMLMGRDHVLVLHAGATPTWLRKCRWYSVPRYAGRIKSTELRYSA